MRGKGEGSIYQRADGSWAGVLQREKKRHAVYGKTRKEVADKLRELRKKLDSGTVVEGNRLQLREYLDNWYASHQRNLAYKTKLSYEKAIERIKDALGNKTLGKLRPDEVQRFLDGLATDKGARTAQVTRNVLRVALNQAVKWRYIEHNPVEAVSVPSPAPRPHRLWSHEEVNKFLGVVKGHRWEALYWVLIYLGLRKGEALALQREDVDLDGRVLHIRGTLQRRTGQGLLSGATKTEGSRRDVPIPAFVIPTLKAHADRQRDAHPKAVYFFTTGEGTPTEPSNINRHFASAVRRAGVPRVTIHDLRHLAATELIRAGVDVSAVAAILGHANPTTTLNTYSHAFDEAKRDAIRKLEERHQGRTS